MVRQFRVETIQHAYLLECVEYCPETGMFTWRDRPRHHFSSYRGYNGWSSACRGRQAGRPNGGGYLIICIDRVSYKAHRLAWFYSYGSWPKWYIDHINGVPSDNRLENLRDVHPALNSRNCSVGARNTSGHLGVHFNVAKQKWQVQVYHQGKNVHIGMFDDLEQAVAARREASIRYGYHENHGRNAIDVPRSAA